MAQRGATDMNDMMATVARHWGWTLAFGVLTAIAGVLVVVWPGETLLIAAIIFGLQLIISAVFGLISAFAAPTEHAWARVLTALVALLSLIVGVYLLRHPVLAIVLIGVLLGIYWIASGFIQLFVAISHREQPARWLVALTGALSLIAGIIVVADPTLSLVFVAWVLGIWLVVFGIITIVRSFTLRSGARPAAPAAGAPAAT
ncbi:MAG: HdeD family acid-resistance protein [Candidatus Dormiibacterota bacterium]